MRSILTIAALLVASCAHPAYGPSSDQRLESSTGEAGSSEGSDAASTKCSDLKPKFDQARDSEKPESERMQVETDVYTNAKERAAKLEDAVNKNPDLLYSAAAEAIKGNLDECRSFYADVRSDFDRFIRDVCDLPVIKEVQGNKDVARIDLGILRSAIAALDPDDKDVLNNKVDAAERKVGGPSTTAKPGKKK
jgi:hypothetical protein